MGRTYVIGDIHSGLRGLEQVLELLPDASESTYIFLGDYIDGWSEASETISFLIEFSTTHSCVFLRGNHDELLYNFLKHNDNNPLWLESGGLVTKKDYQTLSEEKKEQHLTFLENLYYYHIDAENRLFLHAGFTNQKGPQYEHYPNMVSWDRTLWEMACCLDTTLSKDDPNYPQRLSLFKEIYIGHTPVSKIGDCNPENFANVWNLDTGAAWKGSLSIMDINSKEVWQSDPLWKLYPQEKGRN